MWFLVWWLCSWKVKRKMAVFLSRGYYLKGLYNNYFRVYASLLVFIYWIVNIPVSLRLNILVLTIVLSNSKWKFVLENCNVKGLNENKFYKVVLNF